MLRSAAVDLCGPDEAAENAYLFEQAMIRGLDYDYENENEEGACATCRWPAAVLMPSSLSCVLAGDKALCYHGSARVKRQIIPPAEMVNGTCPLPAHHSASGDMGAAVGDHPRWQGKG